MANFKYRGTDHSSGTALAAVGSIEADSAPDAVAALLAKEIQVFEVWAADGSDGSDDRRGGAGKGLSFGRKRVSADDAALAPLQISTLIDSGMSVADAIAEIADTHAGNDMGDALAATHQALRQGKPISEAFQAATAFFPRYVVELISAGEISGRMSLSLRSAYEQMDRDNSFRKEIQGALMYPAILVITGILSVAVVFIFVIPKFASIISNPKADIPAFARMILTFGIWLSNHVTLVVNGAGALGVVGFFLARDPATRQRLWDGLSNIWPFKRWIYAMEVASWAGTLEMMFKNSVNMLDAIRLAGNCFRGTLLQSKTPAIISELRSGKSLYNALQQQGFLDPISCKLIHIGEKSGALEAVVGTIYRIHKDESKRIADRILKLAEPLTIIIISIALGSVMLSIMLAITSMSSVVQ